MANQHPPQYIPGPARTPVKYGLFSVLDFRDDAGPRGVWQGGGFIWRSFDGSGNLGVIGPVDAVPANTVGITKTFSRSAIEDTAGVFTIYGTQLTTPVGNGGQDEASQRALDLLAALAERTVEQVLCGTVAGLTPNFQSTPGNAGSTADMIQAVSFLEGYLADHYGSQGVLHMSRNNASLALSRDGILETKGNGLYTKLGTPVVAGQGYPDNQAWCTSPLVGYRSEVFESKGQDYANLNRLTNDLYAIAEQTYSVGFEDAALGVVTLTTPTT